MNTVNSQPDILIVEGDVRESDLNTIQNYFEKYYLGKVDKIVYHHPNSSCNGKALVYLEYWYNNICAENMYNRILETGEARIVYNDPHYFTVRSHSTGEESADYRDDYVMTENDVTHFTDDNYATEVNDPTVNNDPTANHGNSWANDEYDEEESEKDYGEEDHSDVHSNHDSEQDEMIGVVYDLKDQMGGIQVDVDNHTKKLEDIVKYISEAHGHIVFLKRKNRNLTRITNILMKKHKSMNHTTNRANVWVRRLRPRPHV